MSNVKPIVGQVWNDKDEHDKPVRTAYVMLVDGGFVKYSIDIIAYSIPYNNFVNAFKFVPQNDLEWLAVNESKWGGDDEYPSIFRDMNGDVNYRFKSDNPDCYTRDQWQNMRYELGLDDHPVIKLTKAHAASMGRAIDIKKETEMSTEKMIPIDFSRKITPFIMGDKYYSPTLERYDCTMSESDARHFNSGICDNEGYCVVSFADRQNTGKQPVGDDVIADVKVTAHADRTCLAVSLNFTSGALCVIKSWKPNHAAMLKQYQAEQIKEAKKGDQFMPLDVMLNAVFGEHDKPVITQAIIDLSKAAVGDKFVLRNGDVVSFVATTRMSAICELGNGHAMTFDHDGSFDEYNIDGEIDDEFDITKKHEPRHWLKDLPDADLFHGDVEYIEYVENHGWCYLRKGWITIHHVLLIKMPTLTVDEWKFSKISIAELREWQRDNNAT